MIRCLLRGRCSGEGEAVRFQVDVDFRDVDCGDGEIDDVFFGLGGRGALSPEDWRKVGLAVFYGYAGLALE